MKLLSSSYVFFTNFSLPGFGFKLLQSVLLCKVMVHELFFEHAVCTVQWV